MKVIRGDKRSCPPRSTILKALRSQKPQGSVDINPVAQYSMGVLAAETGRLFDMIPAIFWGGRIVSVVVTLIIFPTYGFRPDIWIAEISGGKEQGDQVLAGVVALLVVLVMVGGVVASATLNDAKNDMSLWRHFLVSWGVIAFFSLHDLIFIDIIIYMWINPPFMQFEGYPTLGYWHHKKASLKGIYPIGAPLSAIAALIARASWNRLRGFSFE